MILLDTDTVTHFSYGNVNVRQKIEEMGDEELAIAVITRNEILQGRADSLLKAADEDELRKAAERFWETIRGGVAAVEPVGAADLETAWQIGTAYRDQDFSLVDRTSFAVMRRLGIERAASFDDHFAIFRFGPNRPRAFTVVR